MPQFIDIHTHKNPLSTDISITNLQFAQEIFFENKFYSAGIHPWALKTINIIEAMTWLEKICKLPSIIAIGETGLDKISTVDYQLQKDTFIKHLEIANYFSKPLIIHSVKSHNEILEIVKINKFNNPLIFHGFIGHPQLAKRLWDQNIYTSFGLQSFSSTKTIETIKTAPLENVFLETDDKKVPIEEIYKEFCNIRKINLEEIKKKFYQNFITTFNLKKQ